jgi:hypothetical protein
MSIKTNDALTNLYQLNQIYQVSLAPIGQGIFLLLLTGCMLSTTTTVAIIGIESSAAGSKILMKIIYSSLLAIYLKIPYFIPYLFTFFVVLP